MINYFIVLWAIIRQCFWLFYEVVKYKLSLIIWTESTEALLFQSFVHHKETQCFIELYFPKLNVKFNSLYQLGKECSKNEF